MQGWQGEQEGEKTNGESQGSMKRGCCCSHGYLGTGSENVNLVRNMMVSSSLHN